MSAIKTLYDDLITTLNTVSGIGTTGKWNNQVFRHADEMAIDYPAVFIEFQVEWQVAKLPTQSRTDKRINQQEGDTTVIFHVLYSSVDYTSGSFGAAMDVVKLIWDKVQGKGAVTYSPLQRVNSLDDIDHDVLRDWRESYTTRIKECPNEQDLTDAAPATITLDIDYE